MIGEKRKRHYVLIKDFNTFMYDHTLHRGKNIFAVIVCKLLVQTKEISKCHFKINGKQRILIPKKGEQVKFNHYERKRKSPVF